jgi:hypothetical protein
MPFKRQSFSCLIKMKQIKEQLSRYYSLLVLTMFLVCMSFNTYAQQQKKECQTLFQVLDQYRIRWKFNFIYNPNEITNYSLVPKITADGKIKTLQKVLLSHGLNIKILNGYYVIRRQKTISRPLVSAPHDSLPNQAPPNDTIRKPDIPLAPLTSLSIKELYVNDQFPFAGPFNLMQKKDYSPSAKESKKQRKLIHMSIYTSVTLKPFGSESISKVSSLTLKSTNYIISSGAELSYKKYILKAGINYENDEWKGKIQVNDSAEKSVSAGIIQYRTEFSGGISLYKKNKMSIHVSSGVRNAFVEKKKYRKDNIELTSTETTAYFLSTSKTSILTSIDGSYSLGNKAWIRIETNYGLPVHSTQTKSLFKNLNILLYAGWRIF